MPYYIWELKIDKQSALWDVLQSSTKCHDRVLCHARKQEGLQADHRGLFVDILDLANLLGIQSSSLHMLQLSQLVLKNMKSGVRGQV